MNRRGFTLIEVLATTVLACGLMLVLLSLLRGVHRGEATVAAFTAQTQRHTPLRRLLEADLRHARTIEPSDGGMTLGTSYAGLDKRTLVATHLPVAIEYRQAGPWLLRTQHTLPAPSSQLPWSEVLLGGVEQVVFEVAEDEADDGGAAALKPSSIRVHVRFADGLPDLDLEMETH